MKTLWKIGELARATGLTVRTLHHYDELGLLAPTSRTGSGYRLYTEVDLQRLQRILSLRQMGFSLEEIRECLDRPEFAAGQVVEMHLQAAKRQLAGAEEMVRRLERLAGLLRAGTEPSGESLIQTMEAITMFDRHYTPEQMEQLRQRAEEVGPDRIREVEQEWPRLIAEVKAEMEKGTDPSDPRVQAMARRWAALVAEFTGGDPGIARSLSNLYQQEPAARERSGLDPALFEYIGRARAAIES